MCAILFLLWIGFGGPKPSPPTLSFSIEGCPQENVTITDTKHNFITLAKDASTAADIEYDFSDFYLL